MDIYKLKGKFCEENTYIVVKNKSCLIIDAGVEGEKILSACDLLGVNPIAVLLTHGHVDHIYGVAYLQKAGIPIYIHKEENDVVNSSANLAKALGATCEHFVANEFVSDGDELDLFPFVVNVIHTPGHTKGGVCYLINGVLFSGDTLFALSYGRTDFPTGDEMDLLNSIANVLFELPENTKVYAGHSALPARKEVYDGVFIAETDTNIANEKAYNPILELL